MEMTTVFMVATASSGEWLAAVRGRSRWFHIVDWDMVALNEQFHHPGAPLRLRGTGDRLQGALSANRGASAVNLTDHGSVTTDQEYGFWDDLFNDHCSSVIERSAGANEIIYCGNPDNNRVPTDIGTGLNDPETELYYARNRSYNSIPGTVLRQEPKSRQGTGVATRVLQRDPIGYRGGINLYEYVHGDPVGDVDPSGEDAIGWPWGYGPPPGVPPPGPVPPPPPPAPPCNKCQAKVDAWWAGLHKAIQNAKVKPGGFNHARTRFLWGGGLGDLGLCSLPPLPCLLRAVRRQPFSVSTDLGDRNSVVQVARTVGFSSAGSAASSVWRGREDRTTAERSWVGFLGGFRCPLYFG